MSIFNRIIILLFLASFYSCSKGNGNSVTPPPKPIDTVELKQVQVFSRSTNGYALFRIPALVRSKAGTLLLFAEARKSSASGDGGDIDLVVKRSSDGGKTWGNMIMVRDDGMNTCGNPVPVVNNETGEIHLLMTWNNDRVFYAKSTDDGLTWSAPREITADVKLPGWTWYGTGPVHGIIIKEGNYKGRIVIPSYASMYENNVKYSRSFIIYSDDNGASWKLGGITKQEKVGEATVAELKGGRLLLNMRGTISPVRTIATSDDGGLTWSDNKPDNNLLDPLCQASLLSHQKDGITQLFFSNPFSSKRENLTIKQSSDEGLTWNKKYQVYSGPSAYSDLTMLDNDNLCIAFETGVTTPHGNILFEKVPLTAIK